MQRRDPPHIRLDLDHLLRPETPDPRNAIGDGAPIDLFETTELVGVARDDQLAALVVGDPALLAVGLEQFDTAAAELRLQRAGRVVDARMHDAAVMAGLVNADLALLVEHRQLAAGLDFGQPARHREAEDPGADHAGSRCSHQPP